MGGEYVLTAGTGTRDQLPLGRHCCCSGGRRQARVEGQSWIGRTGPVLEVMCLRAEVVPFRIMSHRKFRSYLAVSSCCPMSIMSAYLPGRPRCLWVNICIFYRILEYGNAVISRLRAVLGQVRMHCPEVLLVPRPDDVADPLPDLIYF